MTYLPRAIDGELLTVLSGLPAVSIDGAKAVGKTVSASRIASTVIALDDPDEVALLGATPDRLLTAPRPVLLDEWQRYPRSLDMVRRAVDAGAEPGSFILTGSATPREATHSGAGRIVRLRMRPMSFAERSIEETTVPLSNLLSGDKPEVSGRTRIRTMDYAQEIVASGFPGIRELPPEERTRLLDGYTDSLVEHDFVEIGHVVRRPQALRAWITAYAAATSSTASYETILDAATQVQGERPTRATTQVYRDTLTRLWMLDDIPAWLPTNNPLSALTMTSKHFLADPALSARLLKVGVDRLVSEPRPGTVRIHDGTLFGALFEHLAALSVRVHAEGQGARVSHLRTKGGDHEIDLIVERGDGKVVAMEVKLTRVPDDKDAKHLLWLRDKIGDDLLDRVIITAGDWAYRRPDGIAVIPLALLGG